MFLDLGPDHRGFDLLEDLPVFLSLRGEALLRGLNKGSVMFFTLLTETSTNHLNHELSGLPDNLLKAKMVGLKKAISKHML